MSPRVGFEEFVVTSGDDGSVKLVLPGHVQGCQGGGVRLFRRCARGLAGLTKESGDCFVRVGHGSFPFH